MAGLQASIPPLRPSIEMGGNMLEIMLSGHARNMHSARRPAASHRLDRSNLTIRAMGDLGVGVFLGFSCRSGGLARILPKLHLLAPPSSQSREEQSRRATLACTGMSLLRGLLLLPHN